MAKIPSSRGQRLHPRDPTSAAGDELTELRDLPAPSAGGSDASLALEPGRPAGFSGHSQDHEPLLWDGLFNASPEPVLIIDAVSEKIVEGNPAAAALLGTTRATLPGKRFHEAFDSASGRTLRASLSRARAEGRATAGGIRARSGTELNVTISAFKVRSSSYLILNAAPKADGEAEHPPDFVPSAAFRALDDASLGFLVTDRGFRVEYANRGFLALINLKSQLSVRGTDLVRWLGLSAAQIATLGEQFSNRCAMKDLITTLWAERGPSRPVAVSVVPVPDGPNPLWGFCVRELTRLH